MKRPLLISFCQPATLCLAAVLALCSQALAQVTVSTLKDENDTPAGAMVSLREALRDSVHGGQINLDAALAGGVIVLTAGELTVTGKTVTVNAPGGLVIEARSRSRIFRIEAGAGLNLKGLTLQGGLAPTDGGAILSAGPLSLTDCMLRENSAANGTQGEKGIPGYPMGGPGSPGGPGGHGGAVSCSGGFTAVRCHFIFNGAGTGGKGGTGGDVTQLINGFEDGGSGGTGGIGGTGGAIKNEGPLQLTECVFENNQSGGGGSGGGMGYPGGNIPGSNGGSAGDGGAVHQTGDMTVERCTFVSNICGSGGQPYLNHPFSMGNYGGKGGSGAAVYSPGNATLINSTFTSNRVGDSWGQPVQGAAIVGSAQMRLVHCTVMANSATSDAYSNDWNASSIAGVSGPVRCENCIVSGNWITEAGISPQEVNFSSLSPPVVIPFGSPGTATGVNQNLGPLSITSGFLPVLVPGATAPGLNAGAILTGPPLADQRGLPRAVGAPDLGAVEVQATEPAARARQSISFSPPITAESMSVPLSASASTGLPVSFELASGPGTLNGNTLTFTGPGFVAVRAVQPGDAATAPALPVVRIIETPHAILFSPPATYAVYPPVETIVTLPATTSAGLPVTWSFTVVGETGFSLTGNLLTVTIAGSAQIRGQSAGNAQYAALDSVWTLSFAQGNVWWKTPSAPAGAPPWFTLVEGSPHGLSITARIPAAHTGPVAVPALPPNVIATPSSIPAGQTSVDCQLSLAADPLLTNRTTEMPTGTSGSQIITLFLANRSNVPLDVFAPSRTMAEVPMLVDISCPGVPAPGTYGPPPDLAVRTVTVSAVDFDNPAITVPVTLNSVTTDTGLYPKKHLQLTFPPMDRRVRLTVTTDDGISGQAGPIQVYTDPNTDGDGIHDLVETALQRAPNEFDEPPLIIERDAAGLHAVLGSRPLNLQGWTIVIEISTDLQAWTPAPAASITATKNPDGLSERVSVLLPGASETHFVRLKVSKP
jgi:hypothetical protein